MQKIPYIVVVGDKERDANTVAVRARGNVDLGVMSIDSLVERLHQEVASKAWRICRQVSSKQKHGLIIGFLRILQ